MEIIFELNDDTSKRDYAKAFAEMQLERQYLGCDEQLIVKPDPDYELVDPWFDPYERKDIDDDEANELYGINEVNRFIEDAQDYQHTRLLKSVCLKGHLMIYLTKISYLDGTYGYSVVYQDGAETFASRPDAEDALISLAESEEK